MIADPIFIVGTERSGSNLLRLILNTHTGIVVPHPPHVMRYFDHLAPAYGDLTDPVRFGRLAADVSGLVRRHILPWDFTIDANRLAATAQPKTLFGLYLALYEMARSRSGKRRWGCKSTFMLDHVDQIIAHCDSPRIIFLVRDPRDVAASSKRAVFNPYHPFLTAKLWAAQQEKGLALLASLPASTMILLQYEDLVANPESQVRRLCTFLGEPYEPAMLNFFQTRDAKESASLSESWRYAGQPISTQRAGRYRHDLSIGELCLVEAVAQGPMQRLGYALTTRDDERRAVRVDKSKLRYIVLDRLLLLRTELRSMFFDRNHWRRWRRGFYLWRLNMRWRCMH